MNIEVENTTSQGKFLSCLRGSERMGDRVRNVPIFLSCLRGSEPLAACRPDAYDFLSCLRGSELSEDTVRSTISVSELPTRQ